MSVESARLASLRSRTSWFVRPSGELYGGGAVCRSECFSDELPFKRGETWGGGMLPSLVACSTTLWLLSICRARSINVICTEGCLRESSMRACLICSRPVYSSPPHAVTGGHKIAAYAAAAESRLKRFFISTRSGTTCSHMHGLDARFIWTLWFDSQKSSPLSLGASENAETSFEGIEA